MQAIIMAAGKGTRLSELSQGTPKPLVELNGIPLLARQLNSLLKVRQISQVIVVVGYRAELVAGYVKEHYRDKRVVVVENKEFEKGPILSMYAAKEHIKEGFLVCNADHLFSAKFYEKVCTQVQHVLLGTFTHREPYEDERKVVIDEQGNVSLPKKATAWHCGYTGLVAVADEFKEQYFTLAQEQIESGNDTIHPDDLILELAKSGVKIQLLDIAEHTFLEVDTPEDYELAKHKILKIEAEEEQYA